MAFDIVLKSTSIFPNDSIIDEGFAVSEAILSDQECDEIISKLAPQIQIRSRAGARHLMANPAIRRIALDSRLLNIARALLSLEALPFRATLFEKTGKSNWLVVWHQDTALPLKDF